MFSAAAAAPARPAETLKVGSETYSIVSVLQSAKIQDESMSQGVFIVHDAEKKRCVAKFLPLADDKKRKRSLAEARALQRIKDTVRRHENINTIRDAFMPETGPQGTLIVEYCNGGSLADGIDELKRQKQGGVMEPLAYHFFYGIAKGLTMLHHGLTAHNNPNSKVPGWKTICHLDIKPANILLAHNQFPGREHMPFPRIVLADFGCSVTSADVLAGRESAVVQEYGTPGWFPPENPGVTPRDMMGRYGKPTDIWQAAGVIQAMCLLLYQPDMSKTLMPVGRKHGPELNCIVGTCMNADFVRRPTAMDLCQELRRVMLIKGIPV